MFRRLTDETRPAVAILVDGARVTAREGDSVAAAMLAAGHPVARRTALSGAPRAPFCLMGVCFDCLVTIDGLGNRQGCMTAVREGMRVESLPQPDSDISDLGWEGIGPSLPQPSASPSSESISHPPDLRERYDVAVVGAGPAGLAAARLCAEAGLDTVLFDEQAHPGGQIWRCVTASPLPRDTLLGEDYWRGGALVRAALDSGAHYVPGANVWGLLREGEIAVSVAGRSRLVEARRIILATGAIERPFPIPGWTLPGVMTAGGAQILLKSSGLVPRGCTVLAGCGPLLWLIAWQYLNAGVRLDAVLDTAPRTNLALALRHAPSFAVSPYLMKGLRLVLAV